MITRSRGKVRFTLAECDYTLVKEALQLLHQNVKNGIITCPDPHAFREELLVLENKSTRITLLNESFK